MNEVIIYVANLALGVTAVWAVVSKFAIASKYLSLASQTIAFIDTIIKSVSDKALTADEIKDIASKASAIKEAFNMIRGKK